MNTGKFIDVNTRFAEKLRVCGEVKAAEAVESIIKSVKGGMFDDIPGEDCEEH